MKKLILSLTITCLTVSFANAQKWVDMMLQPDANFYEIQAAFEQAWAGKSYVRGQGYKQFKRWEQFWEYRINPDGTFPRFQDMWDAQQEFMRTNGNLRGGGGQNFGFWSPLGPFDYIATDSWSPGHGRINVITEDPNNPNTIYIGAPAGGIWKSTDAGGTWAALGDSLPVIGVSGIAVDPNNSNIIYIATGDNDGGDTYSIGAWKSTDGGFNWTQLATPATSRMGLIHVDPTNSNNLWAASTVGVLKSTDAGATWTVSRAGNFDDIMLKPGDPSTVYACTNSSFHKTHDAGANWVSVSSGLPGGSGRLKMGVSPANPNYLYILAAGGNPSYAYQGVYRSTDSGSSFTARNTTTDIFNGASQAWFDLAICVSPTDAETIITGCLNVWRSTNGGTSFNQLNSWSNPGGSAYTHADIHYLQYFGNNLYCGSDGGIYKSTSNGNTFTDLTPGLQIGQFYTIAGTDETPHVLCGGLQDNGGFAYDHGVWRCYWGADGMGSAVDPTDSTDIFGMIQYGGLYRSGNNGQSANDLGSPQNGDWVTPLEADPDGTRLLAGYDDLWEYNLPGGWNQLSNFNFGVVLRQVEIFPGNSNIIYVSTFNSVYRSSNNGSSWTDITSGLSSGGGISSIETHPTDPNQVWVTNGAGSNSRIYHSIDAGATWTDITGNLPAIRVNVIKYETGSNNGTYIGTDIGIYYRDDNTVNWIPFMNQLPNVIVNDLEINTPTGLIRAGTYGRGVWESGTFSLTTVTDDAGIPTINQPTGTVCGVTFIPEIEIQNFGTNDITSMDIIYSFDGGADSTYSWTGVLTPGSTETVVFPMVTLAPGAHTFNVTTSMPNGLPDNATFNDFNQSNFSVNANGTEVILTINTDCNGSETTWEIVDATNTVIHSGGPFWDVTGGETFVETMCLPNGCYDLKVYDSGNNGLNGLNSGCFIDGDYTLEDGLGNLITAMGAPDFGSDTTFNFCTASPLVAFFTSTKTVACESTPVTFTDVSSGSPAFWSWSFPGGTPTTSNVQNPSVTYNTLGTFDVSLTISNGVDSATITVQDYIEIVSTPIATTSVIHESCAGECDGEVTATVVGGTLPFDFMWNGGLGPGVTHTSVCPGAYNLVLTDDNGCVSPVDTAWVNAGLSGPSTGFTASTNLVFLDQSGDVTFTNTSSGAISYSWDFGDGGTSTATDPTYTYTTPGLRTVVLTATNSDGCDGVFQEDILVLLTNGVDPEELLHLQVYPNPNNGMFTLRHGALSSDASISIVNVLGELVFQTKVMQGATQSDIRLDQAAQGIYYLLMETDEGNRAVVRLTVQP